MIEKRAKGATAMKKILSAIAALLPIIYIASLLVLFLLDATDKPLLLFMVCYCIFAAIILIIFSFITAGAARKFLANTNILLYAGNLCLFVLEIILWMVRLEENRIAAENGAMGGGLGLLLLILLYLPHWFSYLLTRVAGAINCLRILHGHRRGIVCALHTILQLFPVTDLISACCVKHSIKYDQTAA